MYLILITFVILFSVGLYLCLADVFGVPSLASTKAVVSISKQAKKQTKSFEAIIFGAASKITKYIKLSDYKKRKLNATLKSAGIKLSAEMFLSSAIVKTILAALFIIPTLLIIPIISPIIVFLAVAIYFKEIKKADEVVKKKRETIEKELPRFVNTVAQELKASRDILSILESFRKHASLGFKDELEITIADMKSGNHETALTRFESRMGSTQLSEVIRGLISVMRGDNGIVYFQMLSHDLKQLEVQKLKLIAMKRPGKIKKYSFYMLICFMLMYLVIIGVEIMKAMGSLF